MKKKNSWILDSHGLMIYLEQEPGFKKVASIFTDAVNGRKEIYMTTVNFGEVYYIVLRECGARKADQIERIINTLPIQFVDVDMTLSKTAGYFKARGGISYADCFAAALAKRLGGRVITGDREFQKVEDEIQIYWL